MDEIMEVNHNMMFYIIPFTGNCPFRQKALQKTVQFLLESKFLQENIILSSDEHTCFDFLQFKPTIHRHQLDPNGFFNRGKMFNLSTLILLQQQQHQQYVWFGDSDIHMCPKKFHNICQKAFVTKCIMKPFCWLRDLSLDQEKETVPSYRNGLCVSSGIIGVPHLFLKNQWPEEFEGWGFEDCVMDCTLHTFLLENGEKTTFTVCHETAFHEWHPIAQGKLLHAQKKKNKQRFNDLYLQKFEQAKHFFQKHGANFLQPAIAM